MTLSRGHLCRLFLKITQHSHKTLRHSRCIHRLILGSGRVSSFRGLRFSGIALTWRLEDFNFKKYRRMATEKKYDIVVFGATGFTGQYTVDEVARVAKEENLKFAVAGRNMSKLQKVLSESAARTGLKIEETPVIIADTSSYQSLIEMAEQTKLVLNCVGPYRFYGEDVVKACIEGAAHHLDISGEPQFLEKMQLMYNGKAKEKGVFIVGAVGFDSIPAEMGLSYTRKQFNGEVTNVESFFLPQPGPKGGAVNTGTLESAVHGVAHWDELKPLRKSLFPEPMPKYEYRLPKRSMAFYSKEVDKWCVPFMGSDKSVVHRSMRDLLATGRLEKPFEFQPYMCQKNFLQLIGMMIFGLVFGVLCQFSLGRKLLVQYPGFFTFGVFKKGGPTKEQIDGTTFSMTFVAHGYKEAVKDRSDKKPDKTITTKITAPEPGYVTTPICMVQCGVTILKEKEKMFHTGGVFPAGAVFEDTTLLERLQKHNIQFSVVE